MADDYTRDVASRGIQAVRDRRKASAYGPTNQQEALRYLMDTGYSTLGESDGYQQFRQSRGFAPEDYDIAYGRGDGPYSGFRTASDLKAAVLGASESLRHGDQAYADRMAALAQQYLDQTDSRYATGLGQAHQDAAQQSGYNPMGAVFGKLGDVFGSGKPERTGMLAPVLDALDRVPEAGYKQAVGERTDTLNGWLAKTSDPYLDALETAAQIGRTPLADYATIAGAQYGVDPNIVRGWYPDASRVGDFTEQRDLAAINQFGMTQDELESWTRRQESDAANQADADTKAQQDELEQSIADMTGMSAQQLATSAKLTVDQLAQVVGSDTWQAVQSELYGILQSDAKPDDIRKKVDEVLASVQSDPMLYRVLFAQWGAT